jgi:hypothetical protein
VTVAFAGLLVLVLAAGCAGNPRRRTSVPIDSRPTPVQPGEEARDSTATPSPAPMSARTRSTTMDRIVADTTAARAALNECRGIELLPDQEGIVDSANDLLQRVRAAIASGNLTTAESRARQARQLTASLRCK